MYDDHDRHNAVRCVRCFRACLKARHADREETRLTCVRTPKSRLSRKKLTSSSVKTSGRASTSPKTCPTSLSALVKVGSTCRSPQNDYRVAPFPIGWPDWTEKRNACWQCPSRFSDTSSSACATTFLKAAVHECLSTDTMLEILRCR